jgi:hypothetical protein
MAVDYAAFQSGQNPLQMAMQGFSDAGAIQQAQQQQQIGAQTLELNQMKVAEYQKAQAKQQEFQSALAGLGPKPSPQALQKLMMAYPQLGESLKSNFDILNAEQKQNKLMQATQVSSALAAGGVNAAVNLVEKQRLAAENSGDTAGADSLGVLKQQIEMNPDAALTTVDMFLNANMGPEQYASFYEKRTKNARENELQQGKISKQEADIAKILSDMNINVLSEVRQGAEAGIDLTQLIANDSELKKPLQQLAVMSKKANATKKADEREKLQLEIASKKDEYQTKLRERQNEVATSMANIDMVENTIKQLEELGSISKIGGGDMYTVIDAATGPIQSKVFTIDPDVANFEDTLETLNSQVFLSQVSKMKGLGALGVAEGEKLMKGLGSLSLRQTPKQLRSILKQIQGSLDILRELAAKKGGAGLAQQIENIENPPISAVPNQQIYDSADAIIMGN